MEKKLAIAETYLNYEQLDGGRPSISKIAGKGFLRVKGENNTIKI
jgi:hypothetical protein